MRKKGISLVLSLCMFIGTFALPVFTFGSSAEAVMYDDLYEARQQFYASEAPEAREDLEAVYVDTSRIIHIEQEPIEFPDRSLYADEDYYMAGYEPSDAHYGPRGKQGGFNEGDTMDFFLHRLGRTTTTYLGVAGMYVKANLVAQGDSANIWVLDCTDYHSKMTGVNATHNDTRCNLNKIDHTTAKDVADNFDITYNHMTDDFAPHAGVIASDGYDTFGDKGNDGKINILMYDIESDSTSTGGYVAGFFWAFDFITNELDLFHMDIGTNQGYSDLTGTETQKLNFYGTLSHEFQHFLYFVNFGFYKPNAYDSDSWINETLSELANGYYTKPGTVLYDVYSINAAAENWYYGADFVTHYNMKSYGMERMFAHWLYDSDNKVQTKIYNHMRTTYPASKTNAQWVANRNKMSSAGNATGNMLGAVGNYLRAGTGVGTGGRDTVSKVYFLFMEAFAADGGRIKSGNSLTSLRKHNPDSSNYLYNLWWNRFYYYYDDYRDYDYLTTGKTISLNRTWPATYECFYEIRGHGNATNTRLTITPPTGTANTQYYVVLLNQDNPLSNSTTYGALGADVIPVTKGTSNIVETNGRAAFLYVVTFYQNVVNAPVSFNWSAGAGKGAINAGTPAISTQPTLNQTVIKNTPVTLSVTASVPSGNTLSYQWFKNTTDSNIGGTSISGATSSSYSPDTSADGTTYYYAEVTSTNELAVINKTFTIKSNTARVNVLTPVEITTESLPAGIYGAAYSQTVTATGTSPIWELTDGDLPPGLTLDDFTGLISGTPTAVGNYEFTITAENHISEDEKELSITIDKADRTAPALDFTATNEFPKTITILPIEEAEYKFNEGDWSTLGNEYISNETEELILSIRMKDTENYNVSESTTLTINTGNQNQAAPEVFELKYTANNDIDYTVTIPTVENAQYSFNGVVWSENNVKTNCVPGTTVTGYMRIAAKEGFFPSASVSDSVDLPLFKVKTPTASPNGGSFSTASVSVTLSSATAGVSIYYTTNGDTPTESSTAYTGSFSLSATTTIKAIAIKAGMTNSDILTITFTKSSGSGNTSPGGGNTGPGGGGGGGSGSSSAGSISTVTENHIASLSNLPGNFVIPRSVILNKQASLPVQALRIGAAGTSIAQKGTAEVSVGSTYSGQNALLCSYNSATGKFELVSGDTVSSKGDVKLDYTKTGDYVIIIQRTGDITGTGKIETTDALLLLRNIAGSAELDDIQKYVANAKHDGNISTTDVLNILRYVAGIITKI